MAFLKTTIIFTIVIFLFSACGKKDTASNALVGNWKGDKAIDKEYTNGKLTDTETSVFASPEYYKLSFKADKSFGIDSEFEGEEFHESGEYSFSGNQLFLQQLLLFRKMKPLLSS